MAVSVGSATSDRGFGGFPTPERPRLSEQHRGRPPSAARISVWRWPLRRATSAPWPTLT